MAGYRDILWLLRDIRGSFSSEALGPDICRRIDSYIKNPTGRGVDVGESRESADEFLGYTEARTRGLNDDFKRELQDLVEAVGNGGSGRTCPVCFGAKFIFIEGLPCRRSPNGEHKFVRRVVASSDTRLECDWCKRAPNDPEPCDRCSVTCMLAP